jgi:MATE family multidrug resistance protein
MGKLVSKSWQESKLLWHIAFPAILTAVFQFSIGFVTVGFVGHIGQVELAAVTVVENVIEGFAYGVLVRIYTQYAQPHRTQTEDSSSLLSSSINC